ALMQGDARLLFEHDHLEPRVRLAERPGRGEPHDPAAHHDDVTVRHAPRIGRGAGAVKDRPAPRNSTRAYAPSRAGHGRGRQPAPARPPARATSPARSAASDEPPARPRRYQSHAVRGRSNPGAGAKPTQTPSPYASSAR